MKRHLFPALFLSLAVLTPGMAADGPEVRASHVWVREAPPGTDTMAGYFTLENLTGKPISLTGASSPDFASTMLHESVQKDGEESMQDVAAVQIPPHGSIEFKPGSYHLMLMQPKKNYYSGDLVTLMLTFSDKSELMIIANVRRDAPAN